MYLGVCRIRTEFKYDTLKYIMNCNSQKVEFGEELSQLNTVKLLWLLSLVTAKTLE